MSAARLRARLAGQVGPLALEAELDTAGGTLVLAGPNGAGKSSLLSLLLGTRPCRRAWIQIGDTVLVDTEGGVELPVERRRLAYVPQDYALFPHLSVRGNVAFAVRASTQGPRAGTEAERVEAALARLGVAGLADRRPSALSGGERQRVALARALSVEPRALLLDEPLAALDVHGRQEVRAFLAETLRALALPAVVITHDPADARALGERVVVLEAGRASQAGTWEDLERRPATPFIQRFVGLG